VVGSRFEDLRFPPTKPFYDDSVMCVHCGKNGKDGLAAKNCCNVMNQ